MKTILAFAYAVSHFSQALASNWDTYPSVPQTATINGFADPIKDKLPTCAEDCADLSTGNTPCPYWDTGCLCVMPQWSGEVASCIVESCSDPSDVASATSLCLSLCSSVGADVWLMPASLSTALEVAAEETSEVSGSNSAGSFGATAAATGEATSSSNGTVSTDGTSSSSSSDSATSSGSSSSSEAGAYSSIYQTSGFLAIFSLVLCSVMA